MDINIGISEVDRARSADAVAKLLADTYTLYLKTHGYHWNVEGPHFQQLHVLFMEQYTEMWTAVDELAERIRALGKYAPVSYGEMAKLSTIKEEIGRPDWNQMVETLAKGHEQVAKSAREVLRIAEDIGVRANHGIKGTSGAWEAFLGTFCNMQYNSTLSIKSVLLLGEIDCREEMLEAERLHPEDSQYYNDLGSLVAQIDQKVSDTIQHIVAAGKIPIVIGGGHNNSYGNLKGLATATKQAVNCINFDAHSDFRPLEHRHSGNGFSYAKKEGYLNKYFIYGLHKQYTSEKMLDAFNAAGDSIQIAWFDSLLHRNASSISEVYQNIEAFVGDTPFGLEIDLDAIAGMGSSAISPIGFTIRECLQFVQYFSAHSNCGYIHLCEGAPSRELHPKQVGKTLSYLVTAILSMA